MIQAPNDVASAVSSSYDAPVIAIDYSSRYEVIVCAFGGHMNILKFSAIACMICSPNIAVAQSQVPSARPAIMSGIDIIAANFGTLGHKRKFDIATRLQAICGSGSKSCQVFCSETSFGRYNIGSHPICRVIYRCDTGSVRSVEAEREEPILMRCPENVEEALAPPASSEIAR